MNSLASAVAGTDPEAVFDALARVVRETLRVRLFTVMEIDHQRGVAKRSYSNMPEAYPPSGEKPVQDSVWTDQVLRGQKAFVANSYTEIAEVFADHQLIQSLGCESCMNVPIVVCGHVLGTLNCLDKEGFFTPSRVALAYTLQPAGALSLLAAERIRSSAAPVARLSVGQPA